MLGTLDFAGSEHWAPFNFPYRTALIYKTFFWTRRSTPDIRFLKGMTFHTQSKNRNKIKRDIGRHILNDLNLNIKIKKIKSDPSYHLLKVALIKSRNDRNLYLLVDHVVFLHLGTVQGRFHKEKRIKKW